MSFFEIFFLLMAGHAVADYPLQTDFMAARKSHKNSLEAVPWYYVMWSHCMVHSLAVYLVTGMIWLAVAELVLHFVADVLKCEGETNIHVDQMIHVLCKVAWCAIYFIA